MRRNSIEVIAGNNRTRLRSGSARGSGTAPTHTEPRPSDVRATWQPCPQGGGTGKGFRAVIRERAQAALRTRRARYIGPDGVSHHGASTTFHDNIGPRSTGGCPPDRRHHRRRDMGLPVPATQAGRLTLRRYFAQPMAGASRTSTPEDTRRALPLPTRPAHPSAASGCQAVSHHHGGRRATGRQPSTARHPDAHRAHAYSLLRTVLASRRRRPSTRPSPTPASIRSGRRKLKRARNVRPATLDDAELSPVAALPAKYRPMCSSLRGAPSLRRSDRTATPRPRPHEWRHPRRRGVVRADGESSWATRIRPARATSRSPAPLPI